jgi:hypothetical protein
MKWRLAAGAAVCCALAACGGNPGDLMGLEVSGGPLKGAERIRVTADGRASCNGGKLQQLNSSTVLDARNVARDATPLIKRVASFPPAAAGRRTFELRTADGSISWGEGAAGLPAVLPQAELLALELEPLCR